MASGGNVDGIVLSSITKQFDAFTAVDDVSFEIREGEFFSMLGPSGCGKTTTLRMIAGFEEPTTGRILLRGGDVTRRAAGASRNVNMVFQSYALFPHMNVVRNVAFGLRRSRRCRSSEISAAGRARRSRSVAPRGLRAAQARAALGRPAAAGRARARARQPARRRCCSTSRSARSTSSSARRCSSSSSTSRRRRGTTFVYVTHDQEEALTMSDRIAVMNRGHRRADRRAAASSTNDPATAFVAGFIGVSNILHLKRRSSRADSSSIMDLGEGERLRRRRARRAGRDLRAHGAAGEDQDRRPTRPTIRPARACPATSPTSSISAR